MSPRSQGEQGERPVHLSSEKVGLHALQNVGLTCPSGQWPRNVKPGDVGTLQVVSGGTFQSELGTRMTSINSETFLLRAV